MSIEYTAVIRTLGQAGEKYRRLLDSLAAQTVKPKDIWVYIAEGYPLPKETIGTEKYVYVKKGMVAQRALPFKEVNTDWILFLDDDVYLPEDAVACLYNELQQHNAQVIAPCTFNNHKLRIRNKFIRSLTGKELCLLYNHRWAYKVTRTAGFAYNNNPVYSVYESQTNAGPCFFCKKDDFLSISFDEELWLDNAFYALPEDQVMFYKMYKKGLKVLTSFDSGIVHLDAGTTMQHSPEKESKLVFSEYRNKMIFWHRFIYLPDKHMASRFLSIIALTYALAVQAVKYLLFLLLGRKQLARSFFVGLKAGISFLKSSEYKSLPLI